MYQGAQGVYCHTFVYERKDDCPVSSATVRKVTLPETATLNMLIQHLKEGDLRLQAPSLTTSSQTLYMQKPPALEKMTRPNLDKSLSTLLGPTGGEIQITDPILNVANLAVAVQFE